MFLLKFVILFFLSLNIFANDEYVNSLTLLKIKKLVQKEEEIALAYKKYILEKGVYPSRITAMGTDYLPKGYTVINPFGKEITLILDDNNTTTNKKDDKHKIRGFQTSDPTLKSNLYDYYYSNRFRTNTKAPLGINNGNVEIILSSKEKFIYENATNITTVKDNAISATPGKYYLDPNGVLHWYQSGVYKFSFDKDLIVDSSVNILDSNGKETTEFKTLMADKDILYAGQTILYKNTGVAKEYINIGGSNGIVKVNSEIKDIGKTVIQFSRRAGGMIVNGDIYTWGNNANKITGIDLGYTGSSAANRFPVITGLVGVRAKMYDDDSTDGKDFTKYYEQNYFSSPNRPKFVDFFSTVYYSTCGISTKGELYCGGIVSALDKSFGNLFTHVDGTRNGEMLYRSTFFDGKANKAKKVFANNQIWLILAEDGTLYRWGYDHGSGFSGNGALTFNNTYQDTNKIPEVVSAIKFSDVTYLLTIGFRKMAGLSTTGDIYIWGREYFQNGSTSLFESYNCTGNNWEGISYSNLCSPTKVETTNSTMSTALTFESIQGGLDAFVAKTVDGKYYKISHPKLKKIQVTSIDAVIQSYLEYKAQDDLEVLSVDFSRKLTDTDKSKPSNGIVWINSKHELKGDYFTATNKDDEIFKNAIKQIKWKKIKVIDDDNGMCGIDVNNQMYCWGIQSFYKDGSQYYAANTFMIPVFNTNLYDLNKDYLVAEGGDNGYLTNMTSGDWATTNSAGKTGAFFMKYPTYIGGFNYEFIFK